MTGLADSLDHCAVLAEADATDWGPVLAVAVLHPDGVRVLHYGHDLACASPEAIAGSLANLGEMLLGARRGALQ